MIMGVITIAVSLLSNFWEVHPYWPIRLWFFIACYGFIALLRMIFQYSMHATTAWFSPIGKQCHGVCDWHAKGRVNVIGR